MRVTTRTERYEGLSRLRNMVWGYFERGWYNYFEVNALIRLLGYWSCWARTARVISIATGRGYWSCQAINTGRQFYPRNGPAFLLQALSIMNVTTVDKGFLKLTARIFRMKSVRVVYV